MNYSVGIVVGNRVDLDHLKKLQSEFPFVEWGLPLSKTNWNDEEDRWIRDILCTGDLRLVAHASGPAWIEDMLAGRPPKCVNWNRFARIQLNIGKSPRYKPAAYYPDMITRLGRDTIVRNLGKAIPASVELIFQIRKTLSPEVLDLVSAINNVGRVASLLLDARLKEFNTNEWLEPPAGNFPVGYAGGITPDNVQEAISSVRKRVQQKRPAWIDLESGAKDDQGNFDFERVERLLCTVRDLLKPV